MVFIVALVVVVLVRTTAFRGTDAVPFMGDLALLVVLMVAFSGC
jgi:hypothetical protein